MSLLLDTHVLLWAASDPDRLPAGVRQRIEDTTEQVVFSAASIWEIAIKNSLGRAEFQCDPRLLRRVLLEHDYHELAVTGRHAAAVDQLPPIHRDPFDRILVAQAQIEAITLLTADKRVRRYPGPIQLI